MAENVMAVFSGTRLNETVFERALEIAAERRATLVLLDVRHLRQAQHLQQFLSRESPLGPGTVETLGDDVKRQRDHAIDRALTDFQARARRAGVSTVLRQGKGTWETVVRTEARHHDVTTIVAVDDREVADLTDLQVLRV